MIIHQTIPRPKQYKQVSYPSLITQAYTFTKAMRDTGVRIIHRLPATVPTEVQQQRLSTCHACEFFNGRSNRCIKCGCGLGAKTKLAAGYCPIGKWGAYNG